MHGVALAAHCKNLFSHDTFTQSQMRLESILEREENESNSHAQNEFPLEEEYCNFVDHCTTSLARFICELVPGDESTWPMRTSFVGQLVKISAKFKYLSQDPRKFAQVSLVNARNTCGYLFNDEVGGSAQGIPNHDKMPLLPVLRICTRYNNGVDDFGSTTDRKAVEMRYYVHAVQHRCAILELLRITLSPLRRGTALMSPVFSISAGIYQTPFAGKAKLVFEGLGTLSGCSDSVSASNAWSAIDMIRSTVDEIRKTHLGANSSTGPAPGESEFTSESSLENIMTDQGANPTSSTIGNRQFSPVEEPMPAPSRGTVISLNIRNTGDCWESTPWILCRTLLRSMGDVISVIVPLMFVNPAALYVTAEYIKSTDTGFRDGVFHPAQARKTATVQLNDTMESRGPVSVIEEDWMRLLRHIPKLGQYAEDLGRDKKEMSSWVLQEKGVMVSTKKYVAILALICTSLVGGGIAMGLASIVMAPAAVTTSFQNRVPHAKSVFFSRLKAEDGKTIDLVLRQFRCLIADLCQQFNGGHPGYVNHNGLPEPSPTQADECRSAMGMAAIGAALWKYAMRYSPRNPNFFNRDRFVLSNGHTCLFQYAFLHLTGYSAMTLDQLKSYHSSRTDSLCPGHPEIEHPGIEVTTGPLGQGIANAVGLAMATKNLAATYNRPEAGLNLVDNTTWCMIGDACLQEGVALEAIQLAGHWRLNNLVVIYDNNQITCDGSVDLCNTEDVDAKMRACGWAVLNVDDGCYDVESLVAALLTAKGSSEKPTFINVRTVIGIGSKVAGDAKAHGAAYGAEDVRSIKQAFGMNPDEHFVLHDEVYGFFRELVPRGDALERDWEALVARYRQEYPDLHEEFMKRVEGRFTQDWKALIPRKEDLPTAPTPTRNSSGLVCNPLAEKLKNMMVGTADLSPSVNMIWKGKVDFQHPELQTSCGINGDYSGRYIHWGVREHAMASISNGIAAFNKGTFLPVTSSFFMFYIYAAPGVRMGALQHLQAIHIATHDSIGTGEDGPTHQPVELAALYRAMPNILYIRPCDSEEVAGAYTAALEARDTPSIISLSRQAVEQYPQHSSRDGVIRGAYVFIEEEDADVTLIGVGAELSFAVKTRHVLGQRFGIKARVVSFPCQRLFDAQPLEYKRQTLRYQSNTPRVVIEAYAINGWERYADAGFSMSTFGKSLPGKDAYKYFGFDEYVIAPEVAKLVEDVRRDGVDSLRGEFRDLNPVRHFHS
ncbi:stress response protein nst1 [Purpureocillium lavendulum]|uniref:transketolase n=1 Tax=Purpureocillium lavendulum TaxID=1247861 RepID=A0AB34G409_9HYPO|nr:stress response protein nst1 [Purpureocillium lavendulum]